MCFSKVIEHMDEHDEHLNFAKELLLKIASDNMPDGYHHRHHTGMGSYHEYVGVCLIIIQVNSFDNAHL